MILKNISNPTNSRNTDIIKTYININNHDPNDNNNLIIVNSQEFDKYIYDKIFNEKKIKIINNSNNKFMKNIIDKAIIKNNISLKYTNDI
jgi:hypothetical protein